MVRTVLFCTPDIRRHPPATLGAADQVILATGQGTDLTLLDGSGVEEQPRLHRG